jgi:hypothetical protein
MFEGFELKSKWVGKVRLMVSYSSENEKTTLESGKQLPSKSF